MKLTLSLNSDQRQLLVAALDVYKRDLDKSERMLKAYGASEHVAERYNGGRRELATRLTAALTMEKRV